MAGRITVEHNGYEIVFNEGDDEWACYALKVENTSLAKLKAAINKISADARRLDAVPVYVLRYSDTVERGTATLIDGDKVWVMVQQPGNAPPSREKLPLENVVMPTKDNMRLLADLQEAKRVSAAALQEVSRAKAAIPRATADDLRSLKDKA